MLKYVTTLLIAFSITVGVFSQMEAASQEQVITTRKSDVTLTLPKENESFTFLVFADRTTGTPEGLPILADAVRDANRLKPDFVMNIGDMVQGYNTTEKWLEQMREYKAIMADLECHWYPVAGNHDIYGGKAASELPKGQHEKEFEEHFGPLWYAFEYKNNWFIALFTDEGNLETGEKSFNKPENQKMSDAQFEWLQSVLEKSANADGVYVFQHHPRWLGDNYGNDWDKVHAALVKAGNVKAVFAGHIHVATTNEKDGIQYMTLATTGGKQDQIDPEAGRLHEIRHISVHKNTPPTITILPVKSTLDVSSMPARRIDDAPADRSRSVNGRNPENRETKPVLQTAP